MTRPIYTIVFLKSFNVGLNPFAAIDTITTFKIMLFL